MTELYWKIILLEGDYERLILLFHSGMYFKNIMEIFKQKSREIFHSKHLYTDHLHSTINILLYMPYISIHFDSSIHPSVFFFLDAFQNELYTSVHSPKHCIMHMRSSV